MMRFKHVVGFSDSGWEGIAGKWRSQWRASVFLYGVLAIFTDSTAANGLGDLQLHSYLGDPLHARIAIIPGSGDPVDRSLAVRIVSVDEAQSMGVDILYVPYQFDATIQYGTDSSEILISTSQAVKEPFFSVLIELRSAFGARYQEYTVMLDPAFIAEHRGGRRSSDIAGDISRRRAGTHSAVQKIVTAGARSTKLTTQTGRATLGAANNGNNLREVINPRRRNGNRTSEKRESGINSADDAYLEALEQLVQQQQEQITRLTRYVNSVPTEAQAGSVAGLQLLSRPENVGLQLIGHNFVLNGARENEVLPSLQGASLASTVPGFRESQALPSYRVIGVAGVGVVILIGGMILYRRKHYYHERISDVTLRDPGASLPPPGGSMAVSHCQPDRRAVDVPTQIRPQLTDVTGGRPLEETTLRPVEKHECSGAYDAAHEGFIRDFEAASKGRSDDAVRNSIAQKVSQYPGFGQCQTEHIIEVDDWDYPTDDLGCAIEQARLLCEFKQFKSAREVLEPLTGIDDVRLYEAIAKIEIQEIENKKLHRH